MNIILLGYMASGKSIIGNKLAEVLNWDFIDLDNVIEFTEDKTIQDIFKTKGEIYFRKVESNCLKNVLKNANKSIIAVGGGTPCYANNIDLILNSENTRSIYLNVSILELTTRLIRDKEKRPLVSHISNKSQMAEFIGKHLFERLDFYNRANITVDANQNIDEVVKTILLKLF